MCFESAPAEDNGRVLHSLVAKSTNSYLLPPLSQLSVVRVDEGEFEYLPGKIIKQTLITVQPTYLLPAKKLKTTIQGACKFAGDCNFLTFGNAQDAVRGIEDITEDPVLTMEQEWARNEKWQDWKGANFNAWSEFLYVTTAINHKNKSNSTSESSGGVGARDAGHDGWTPETFRTAINAYIKQRRSALGIVDKAGDDENSDTYYLTLEEVISIRLYTGPGYGNVMHKRQ